VSGETAQMLPAVTAEAIAAAIEMLITDAALRERIAREGMGRVREHFDIRGQAARMDAFCCAVAGGAPATAAGVSQMPAASAAKVWGWGNDNLCLC
jgi:DNA-binding transcriptional regulator YdaS (Cro superfamily)